jgi:RNA polymerase sigma factor (sigma-70 family)
MEALTHIMIIEVDGTSRKSEWQWDFEAVEKIKINPHNQRGIWFNSGHLRTGGVQMGMEKESGFGQPTEATLIKQAQAGCQESMNLLLLRNEGLVHLVVQRQWLSTLPYDQAIQAGRQGLWRAILGFDLERKNRFSTYAYAAIMRQVWAAVKAERRRQRRETLLGVLAVYWYQSGTDPARLREQQEIGQSLRALVKRLPLSLGRVIEAYYGLAGQEPQSLQAIGEKPGLSGERVRQLRNEALMWLRQPAHSQELRSLLARHNQAQYELADRLAQIELKRCGGRNGRR